MSESILLDVIYPLGLILFLGPQTHRMTLPTVNFYVSNIREASKNAIGQQSFSPDGLCSSVNVCLHLNTSSTGGT